ncbi:MAG: ATP-binding protein [Actinomycetota bacterium]|nr:ATP-binding protein [Actinomycetota bacterium]
MERLTILHLEDSPMDQELIAAVLKGELDCTVEAVGTRDAFTAALETCAPDVILLDYNVPGFDGLTALELARERFPDIPVIFVSGTLGDELAAQIIKRGACDYVLKDHTASLPSAILRALEESRMQTAYREAQEELRRANDELEFKVLSRTAELAAMNERLENEARERRYAETRLENALKYAPFPIMLHAEDGQVLVVNECWQQTTGYSSADIPTIEDWTEKAYGSRKDMVRSNIKHLFESDAPIEEGEDTITTHEGATRAWAFKSAPLGRDSSGRRLVITMSMDVTDRKQTEQDLDAARLAAETANVAKSRFLANMSHELRTPLGTTIGFAQLLQEQLLGDLNLKQQEQVGYILESARHLLSLINDILDLSKIEAGKMELRPSQVRLADLLEGSLNMVREQCLRKGVALALELGPDAQAVLLTADERMLKQVMFNLLSNAMKFTPRDGRNIVSARIERDEIVVSVVDTGIGIAPEQQEAIFEEFYQVRSDYSDKTAGTGLGLPLVAQMVALHGGRTWLESAGIDKGSTFSFAIPLKRQDEPTEEAAEQEASNEGPLDTIETFISHHDHVCLCRFEPLDLSAPVDHVALLQGLESGKRAGDLVLEIASERYALLLTDIGRQDAETACRRIAVSLETTLAMPWHWAIAVSPDEGRDPEGLLEILSARIVDTP